MEYKNLKSLTTFINEQLKDLDNYLEYNENAYDFVENIEEKIKEVRIFFRDSEKDLDQLISSSKNSNVQLDIRQKNAIIFFRDKILLMEQICSDILWSFKDIINRNGTTEFINFMGDQKLKDHLEEMKKIGRNEYKQSLELLKSPKYIKLDMALNAIYKAVKEFWEKFQIDYNTSLSRVDLKLFDKRGDIHDIKNQVDNKKQIPNFGENFENLSVFKYTYKMDYAYYRKCLDSIKDIKAIL
jgi:hypothetical protein